MEENWWSVGKDESVEEVGSDEVYKDKAEPVLASPLDLYSELDSISVGASSTLLVCFILFTDHLTTDYCSQEIVNNFVLRKMFYSKWGLKDTCHSPTCTGHKWTLQHRAPTQENTSTLLDTINRSNIWSCRSSIIANL